MKSKWKPSIVLRSFVRQVISSGNIKGHGKKDPVMAIPCCADAESVL